MQAPGALRVSIVGVLACMLATAAGCAGSSDADRLARIERMYRNYKKSFPDTPELTVKELSDSRDGSDTVIVDVRESAERDVSVIPGAISKEALEQNIEQYRGRRIVTYCTIGYRSGLYAKALRAKGLDAHNLRGSILAWTHAGQEVTDDDGVTRRVHVYGQEWDLLPAGYEAVVFTAEQRDRIEGR